MLLDKILEYQEIDMNLYNLEKEFRKSPEAKRLQLFHNKYKEQKEVLSILSKEAMETMTAFKKSTQRINELDVLEGYVDEDISQIDDLSELDLYNKSLLKYEECISSIDKDINRAVKRLTEIKIEAQKLYELIRELKAKIIAQKKIYEEKQGEVQQQALPYIKQLKQLQENIDSMLIKKYTALRNEKKMPAFVEYADGNCTGCGMQIFIEVNSKLQNKGDYAECPECRRIVYKP